MREPLNKKIVAMLIVAILVVVGVIGVDLIKKHLASKRTGDIVATPTLEEILPGDRVVAMDTDSDGLFDWEEELHETDPQNPDTDGDGETDGIEVRGGNNPLTPGANATTTSVQSALYGNVPYVPGSLSETVATSFISNYTLLNQAGRLDEETLEQLSFEIAQEAYRKAEVKGIYIVSDVKTFTEIDKERIRQYGNTFASIQNNYYEQILAADKTDDSYISTIVALYTSFAEELIHVPTPAALATTHVDFANNIYKTGQALPHIANKAQDPVRATIAENQYEVVVEEQTTFSQTIAAYFKSNGILFNNDELGSMWNTI
jgi:hypothetical protein